MYLMALWQHKKDLPWPPLAAEVQTSEEREIERERERERESSHCSTGRLLNN